MNPGDELPAGWLTRFRRGVLSGAGLLLLAVGLCAIPAFAVWLVPGADTTPASTAVKAGALLALSAPHGGLVLNGVQVSLTPLLVTAMLGWLVLAQARRSESVSGLLGLTVGYGIASGLLAKWATLGATRAPALRSMLAAMLFVLLVGGVARLAEAHWRRLPERWQRVVRAAGVACCCYLLAGSLLAAGMIAGHFQDAVAMQRQLAPGAAGLPIALLGVAATPNAVLAAVGYLTGPGFQIGPHTSVSVVSVNHGTLPTFPLLAGVPHGRPVAVLGVLVIALLAVLVGWLVLRVIAATSSWLQRLTDAAAVAALTAGALAAASALASGGLGGAALHGIGPVWWAVGAATLLTVLFGSASWLSVEVLRGRDVLAPARPAYPLRAVPAAEPAPAKAADRVADRVADSAADSAAVGTGDRTAAESAGQPAGNAGQPAGNAAQAALRSRNAG